MDDKKSRLLSDEALGVLMDRQVQQAVGVNTSRLSTERRKVMKYYDGTLPRPQHAGQSSYVSTDVYDAVEAMKADLLETFSGSQNIVKFAPQGPNDVEPARIATEFCSFVVHRQNPGYHIFHDALDDGLKARVGIVKVYWDPDEELVDETFDSQPEEAVITLAGQDEVKDMDATANPDGTYSGKVTKSKDKSQIRIENVPPENFGVASWAKNLRKTFHYQRELMTQDEIEAMGWDFSKLKDVNPITDDADRDIETQARFNQIESGYTSQEQEAQPEMKKWQIYECIDTFIKYKGDRPRLYKTVVCGKVVLDCTEINRSPFKVFCPLRVAHSFWGNNFAAKVIPTQNARTVLTRSILDHAVITNNPRYTVLQGALTNPKEMLDNRLGGIVNTTRPDAVAPLLQPSLNPFVFQTLAMLKDNSEQTTGISSLSQGLNKDAISQQNSQGMVEGLVDLSKQRQKVVARNFAEFIAEVYIEVYNLTLENQERYCVVEVAGNWVDVDPSSWEERKTYSIQFFLGQAAADAEAMKLTALAIQAKQDPFLARSMGDEGTYNLAQDIAETRGIKTFSRYFKPPAQTPPAQPSPEMLDLQFKQQELPIRLQEAQLKLQVEQTKATAEVHRSQTETALAQADAQGAGDELALKWADSHRKDLDVANRIDIGQRELQIVEKAPPADLKAIAAPRG
jgi:hypothetical protein